jgi:nicotinamide riboside transporter PnuC
VTESINRLAHLVAQHIPLDAQPLLLVPIFCTILYLSILAALRLANKPLCVLLGLVLNVAAVTLLFLEAALASVLRCLRLAVPGSIYALGDSVVPAAKRSQEAVTAGSRWLSTTVFGVLVVPAIIAGWALYLWNNSACTSSPVDCVPPAEAWLHLIGERF